MLRFLQRRRPRSSQRANWDDFRSGTLSWPELQRRLATPVPMGGVELWMLRHGETTTNAAGLVTGRSDAPLTEQGRQQARAAGAELAGRSFEAAVCSALQRSRETLDLILQAGDVHADVIGVDDRLNERALGEMELQQSRPVAEFAAGDLQYAPEGGENYCSVAQRCLSFLLDVHTMLGDTGGKALVCTHMGPMRIFAGILQDMTNSKEVLDLSFANSAPVVLTVSELKMPRFLTAASTGMTTLGTAAA
jgi:broad specificity phosphatase PhoE